MYIDSHAHICGAPLVKRLPEILLNAAAAQLSHIIHISCSPKDWEKDLAVLNSIPNNVPQVRCSLGIHPDHFHDPTTASAIFQQDILEMRSSLRSLVTAHHKHVVAIGECGLDYYRTYHRDAQIVLFQAQIQLAHEFQLPLVVHLRGEIWDDFFDILSTYPDIKAVIHCFGGSETIAKRLLAFPNIFLSFTGIITFKNAQEQIVPILKAVPLERRMIETDCPYLAPVPYRGEENEPAYVVEVARKIGEIQGISMDEVGRVTTETATQFFKL